jgi:dolichyl-phosphate beta-glucosyltransferase
MEWLHYLIPLVVVAVAAVYGVVIVFSHSPRAEFEEEGKYITNDANGEKYDLPTRLNSTSGSIKSDSIELSIIIPCYNEVKRLGKMLDEAIDYLQKNYRTKFEFIIVDDGSSDGTDKFAISKANEFELPPHVLKVVHLRTNRGKGGAVTHGLLHSQGKLCLFADADGATSFPDISKLIASLKQVDGNAPAVAIGSRAHMVNTDAVVKRSFIRNFLMYCLHALVFVFGIQDIKDTQCGFKMFNHSAITHIFPHMHTERWIFDVEVLLLAEMQNIPIKEIPVNWQEVDGSKIDIARDSIEMAIDLVVTRLAYILGIYKLNENGNATKKGQ